MFSRYASEAIVVQFDRSKFLAAVHYLIAQKSSDPDSLGKTKLHKCLYYADMMCFIDRGEALTGVEYRKAPFGPTARYLEWALKKLTADGQIEVSSKNFYGLKKFDFRSLKPVGSNSLTAYDRRTLDLMLEFVCGFSAKEISEISHAVPWRQVEMGETIPYASAYLLLPPELPTKADLAWAADMAGRA